jgi:hypothetical protein
VLVRCLSCAIGTIAPSNSVATSTLLSNTKDHICLCGHLPQSRQLHGSKWLCTQRTLGDFASCATPHFLFQRNLLRVCSIMSAYSEIQFQLRERYLDMRKTRTKTSARSCIHRPSVIIAGCRYYNVFRNIFRFVEPPQLPITSRVSG